MLKEDQKLENILEAMWVDYCKLNPQAYEIFNSLKQTAETVVNDHIALRTFQHPKLGLDQMARYFVELGYVSRGEYHFKEKKLYAQHFEHKTNIDAPKIFISELKLNEMPASVQSILNQAIKEIPETVFQNDNFLWSGTHWEKNYKTYTELAQVSEYASWVYAHGFRPNHFTVNINKLKKLNNISELNQFIESLGYELNSSGGKIKGSPEELLEQSSTMANEIPVEFADGKFNTPGCYYEFAKRYETTEGKLYQGFIAKSADKIFESTDRVKK